MNPNTDAKKEWTWVRGDNPMGRKWNRLTCPFCGRTVRVYVWSFAGCGKRCPDCGAFHSYYGYSYLEGSQADPLQADRVEQMAKPKKNPKAAKKRRP